MSAKAFQGGDCLCPRFQVAARGAGHPDAADQQGGQADQHQIKRQPVNEGAQARLRLIRAADPPVAVRERRVELVR